MGYPLFGPRADWLRPRNRTEASSGAGKARLVSAALGDLLERAHLSLCGCQFFAGPVERQIRLRVALPERFVAVLFAQKSHVT